MAKGKAKAKSKSKAAIHPAEPEFDEAGKLPENMRVMNAQHYNDVESALAAMREHAIVGSAFEAAPLQLDEGGSQATR